MLRIIRYDEDDSRVTLGLQGRIVSEWVALLEQECLDQLRSGRAVRLDFSEVTFVGRKGAEMLRELAGAGVEIIGCSPLIQEVIDGTVPGARRRRVRPSPRRESNAENEG